MFSFRRHRRVPELNTTSTADISFMLLTFFLVTTSMDVDKGIVRQLPPMDDVEQEDETRVERSRMMNFRITADSQVLLNDVAVDPTKLQQRILKFLVQQGPKHIITIDADPASSYNAYFTLENEIVAAYRLWRNREAERRFRKSVDELTAEQRETIRNLCPQHVSETYQTAEKGAQR